MKNYAMLVLLLTAPLAAQPFEIDNADCTGLDTPYNCCTGAGTGSCDDSECTAADTPYSCCTGLATGTCKKGVWQLEAARYLFVEGCASFWFAEHCGSMRDINGDGTRTTWLVDAGVCSLEEAAVRVPLKTRAADCTDVDLAVVDGRAIEVPWCTGAGTSDGSEHVQVCSATAISNNRCQGAGVWDFTDSDLMPKSADCAKAFNVWFKSMLRRERNQGRLNWEILNRPSYPESTDPLE